MTKSQAERLAHEVSKHKGEYVLVRGTSIVAHDKNLKAAMRKVRAEDRKDLHVRFCPSKDFTDSTFSAF